MSNELADLRFVVLITSDRAAEGIREDGTGPRLKHHIEDMGGSCVDVIVTPDEYDAISTVLNTWSTGDRVDVILTSGGTGIAPRDVTVDATKSLIDKELPGFGEEMRRRSLETTPYAILSRATCGTLGNSLVLNLPGSPNGAVDCLGYVSRQLRHTVRSLQKKDTECPLPTPPKK